MLEDLAGWVTEIYRSCIGENVVTIPSAVCVQCQKCDCVLPGQDLHHRHAAPHRDEDGDTHPAARGAQPRQGQHYISIYLQYLYVSTSFISTYLQPLYLHIYTGGGGAGVVRGGAPRAGEGGAAGAAAEHGGHQEQGSAGPRPRPAVQVAAELPTNLCEVSQFPEKAPTGY